MSVVIETTLGDITVDLFLKQRPRACLNFLKLCKIKYYNFHLFHTISRGFIAQTGDPTGKRTGGESIFGVLEGPLKRYFEAETTPRIKHTNMGMISFVGNEESMIGSQFFFTLGTDLTYLDEKHCVFGEVVEGLDVVEIINEAICDTDDRPYQDIRITHTVVLDDPLPDPERLRVPERSPSPSAERMQGGRIAPDEEIDETAGKTAGEINELLAEREAKARATILEMVGDLPDAEMAPPENVLFVCKLNPVTSDDDLEIIFSRFGKINSCEVIRDRKTGDSLQYAFVEFAEQKSCEEAYFKMDNVLIDDRRIHVDFSQSVSKVKWLGKGRGVKHFGEKDGDLGKGQYQRGEVKKGNKEEVKKRDRKDRSRSRDKIDRGGDRVDRSRDRIDRSRDKRDRSRDKRDRSRDKRDRSRSQDRRNRNYRGGGRERDYRRDRIREDERRDKLREDERRDRIREDERRDKIREDERRDRIRENEKRDRERRREVERRDEERNRDRKKKENEKKELSKKSEKKRQKNSHRRQSTDSSSEEEERRHKDKHKKSKKRKDSSSSSESEPKKKKKKSKKKRKSSSSSSSSS